MTDANFQAVRNKYWNAFKHSTTRGGVDRDDSELLNTFSERENEERLFIGWSDYGTSGAPLPVEAQVYTTWFLALDFSKFAPDIDPQFLRDLAQEFPGLSDLPSDRRKRRLRQSIERWRKDRRGKNDPRTDPRPLMLGVV